MEVLAFILDHREQVKDIWVPLFTACLSLLSVIVAFSSLVYSRRDRQSAAEERKQERIATTKERESERKERIADSKAREQELLLRALQGEKESVGFMALEIARRPSMVTAENRERLLTALCTSWVFESSSRARAIILRALKLFNSEHHKEISDLLKEIERDFDEYDKKFQKKELEERRALLKTLITVLEEHAAQQGKG